MGKYDRLDVAQLISQPCGEAAALRVDFPPGDGGVGSERHAAARVVTPCMLARASAGVR
jgi:hypothetical protein